MDEAYGRDWREGNGRKSKKDAVEEWQRENPGRRKADCMRELGITRPTVMKYWQETAPKAATPIRNPVRICLIIFCIAWTVY